MTQSARAQPASAGSASALPSSAPTAPSLKVRLPPAAASATFAAPATATALVATAPSSAATTASPAAVASTAPAATGTAAAAPPSPSTCEERIPEGKSRPQMKEVFPERGSSGHVAVLQLTLEHGEGERVLPGALKIQSGDDDAKLVSRRGFVFPQNKSPVAPSVKRNAAANGLVTTVVEIPVVPLPKEPGRHELTLPSLPIAMARGSGEVLTLCTEPHTIVVEDPIANQPTAKPMGNPSALRQEELWVTLRNVVYGTLVGLGLAAVLALLYRWWSRRPHAGPPPPPPRPPWEIALESLHDIRFAKLLEQGRLGDHFDRVSNTLRRYLGDRYGFDGLESTTTEIVAALSRVQHPSFTLDVEVQVRQFLEESDLVKFANQEPTEAQCLGLWDRAKHIVDETRPVEGVSAISQVTENSKPETEDE